MITETECTAGPATEAGETLEVSQVFAYDSQALRVVHRDGEPWFCAADVAACLDLENPSMMIQPLDDDEKGLSFSYTPGGRQQMAIVSEAGLYTVVLRCRNALKRGTGAYNFRRWVAHEVLPAIRKTGSYGLGVEPDPIVLRARQLLDMGFPHDSVVSILAPGHRRANRLPGEEASKPLVVGRKTVARTAQERHELFDRMVRAIISNLDPTMPAYCGLSEWVSNAGETAAPWQGIEASRELQTSLGIFLRTYEGRVIYAGGRRWKFESLAGRHRRYLLTPEA